MSWDERLDVLLIGGGMISQEVVLPTLFQDRRRGIVGNIAVSSLNSGITKQCRELFPKEEFSGYPDPEKYAADDNQPTMYREAMTKTGTMATRMSSRRTRPGTMGRSKVQMMFPASRSAPPRALRGRT